MSELPQLHPDRWLICSPVVDRAIRGPLSQEADADSLTALRLRSDQTEVVTLADLQGRVADLVQQGCGTLHIVVERMGAEEIAQVTALKRLGGHKLLHVWREAPLAVMGSLSAPEQPVLEAWQAERRQPRLVLAGDWPAGYRLAYEAALRHWAREARVDHAEAMAQTYDPIPELTSIGEVLAALGRAAAASLSAGAAAATVAAGGIVRVVARHARVAADAGAPSRPRLGGFSAADDGPMPPPTRTWQLAAGLTLSVPMQGYDGRADIQIIASATPEQARVIRRAVVRFGDTPPVDLCDEYGSLTWQDDGSGGAVAICEVPCSEALSAAIADERAGAEVQFETGSD